MGLKVWLSTKNVKILILSRLLHIDIYLNKKMCLSINTKKWSEIVTGVYTKTDLRIQKLEELLRTLKWD